jgi:phage terminase large subunit-like protein
MTYSARALRYAQLVVANDIPACLWVKLAAKRHLDDLAKVADKSYPFYFDDDSGDAVCEFIETLTHVKGKWARPSKADDKRIRLEDWQCFLVCVGFGWLKKKNSLRRFRKWYWRIPRKNGKSVLAAAIGLYMWCMDDEPGAEVYSGATTEKQAWEVYRPARLMVESNEELLEHVGQSAVHAKTMVTESDASRFEPIIGKPGDGASPSCAIADEYHEHETNELVDTMETGMGAREQPVSLKITTAGYNLAGPCYDEDLHCQEILKGTKQDEEVFCIMYGIDDVEYEWAGTKYKPDDWALPEALRKANPNLGISVEEDFLLSEQRQAMLNPLHQNRFKTKHLNIWCSARTAWMNILAWNLCADRTLRLEQFAGSEAFFILDLASKDDVAAFIILLRKKIKGEWHYYIFARYYIPEKAIEEPGPNQAAYRKWKIEGFLTTTDANEGTEIDFETIQQDVLQVRTQYKLQVKEILYDPWRATQLAQALAKSGATVVEFRQTVQNLSAPMKELNSAVKAARVHHDGNPVTTWMIGNVTAKADAKDNIYPRKERPQQKIDGAVATIMGVARAMLNTGGDIEDWLKAPVNVTTKPAASAASQRN